MTISELIELAPTIAGAVVTVILVVREVQRKLRDRDMATSIVDQDTIDDEVIQEYLCRILGVMRPKNWKNIPDLLLDPSDFLHFYKNSVVSMRDIGASRVILVRVHTESGVSSVRRNTQQPLFMTALVEVSSAGVASVSNAISGLPLNAWMPEFGKLLGRNARVDGVKYDTIPDEDGNINSGCGYDAILICRDALKDRHDLKTFMHHVGISSMVVSLIEDRHGNILGFAIATFTSISCFGDCVGDGNCDFLTQPRMSHFAHFAINAGIDLCNTTIEDNLQTIRRGSVGLRQTGKQVKIGGSDES